MKYTKPIFGEFTEGALVRTEQLFNQDPIYKESIEWVCSNRASDTIFKSTMDFIFCNVSAVNYTQSCLDFYKNKDKKLKDLLDKHQLMVYDMYIKDVVFPMIVRVYNKRIGIQLYGILIKAYNVYNVNKKLSIVK